MTHDELREKVAAIIRRGAIYPVTSDKLAYAAIALVLEETARVVDHYSNHDGGRAASAIRALIPKAPESPEQA